MICRPRKPDAPVIPISILTLNSLAKGPSQWLGSISVMLGRKIRRDGLLTGTLIRERSVEPAQGETVSRAIGRARVNFFVSSYDGISSIDFADAPPKIADQFVERFVFGFGGQISVEVAHQA